MRFLMTIKPTLSDRCVKGILSREQRGQLI